MSEIKPKSNTTRSGRGGPRPGAGRPAGTPNRATIDQKARLSDLAKSYAGLAFDALVEVAQTATSPSARVSAACAILDRAFGKPGTCTEADPDGGDRLQSLLMEVINRGGGGPGPGR